MLKVKKGNICHAVGHKRPLLSNCRLLIPGERYLLRERIMVILKPNRSQSRFMQLEYAYHQTLNGSCHLY
jgi:hypothetical protein